MQEKKEKRWLLHKFGDELVTFCPLVTWAGHFKGELVQRTQHDTNPSLLA